MSDRAPSIASQPRIRAVMGAWPRGLRRDQAAAYLGVSCSKLDDWVRSGLMPSPKKIGGVVVWDRLRLDESFEALPDESARDDDDDKWDDVAA